jgi:hypothetical protein
MVILDKMASDSGLIGKGFLVKTFKEKTAIVFKDSGFDNQNLRNIRGYDVHPSLLVTEST